MPTLHNPVFRHNQQPYLQKWCIFATYNQYHPYIWPCIIVTCGHVGSDTQHVPVMQPALPAHPSCIPAHGTAQGQSRATCTEYPACTGLGSLVVAHTPHAGRPPGLRPHARARGSTRQGQGQGSAHTPATGRPHGPPARQGQGHTERQARGAPPGPGPGLRARGSAHTPARCWRSHTPHAGRPPARVRARAPPAHTPARQGQGQGSAHTPMPRKAQPPARL